MGTSEEVALKNAEPRYRVLGLMGLLEAEVEGHARTRKEEEEELAAAEIDATECACTATVVVVVHTSCQEERMV